MTNSTSAYCAIRGTSINVALDDPSRKRTPCTGGGSTSKKFEVANSVEAKARASLGMKHKRPGVRKPLAESFSGVERRKSVGDLVQKFRLIDRQNDRYMERVVTEHGEVLRDVDHKLTEHVGRALNGSSLDRMDRGSRLATNHGCKGF